MENVGEVEIKTHIPSNSGHVYIEGKRIAPEKFHGSSLTVNSGA